MRLNGGVQLKSIELEIAQGVLGVGNRDNQQAIIPMIGSNAGDPHTLSKSWTKGSMFWQGWDDIKKMQEQCSNVEPLSTGTLIMDSFPQDFFEIWQVNPPFWTLPTAILASRDI